MNHLRKMPPVASAITQKPRTNTTKKKSKNLIKVGNVETTGSIVGLFQLFL